MTYTFEHGQQPLPGYTIKCGIGKGSFGEVYFAVSAGGKEVALKYLRDNADVELRGVRQCLNLKHAHLVHLYDLCTDAQGRPWLVMEYIAGDSLAVVLERHKGGVAVELAGAWFLGLAEAIHYLHEHGLVHRDLKPGNLFLENGLIKVGDYGLCKLLSHSTHADSLNVVGTYYYMAPEIGSGKYSKSIDIYAAGVILYEMLTGTVPFDGVTPGEIIAKHLQDRPDLARVPAPFRAILQRALEKDAARRYGSMREMARDVTAALAPPQTTILPPIPPWPTPKATAKVNPSVPPIVNLPEVSPSSVPTVVLVGPTPLLLRWAELTGQLLLAVPLAGLLAFTWTLFASGGQWDQVVATFYVTLAATWAVLASSKLWPAGEEEDSWSRRLTSMTLGFLVGLLALWLQGYTLPWPWQPGAAGAEVMLPWQPGPDQARPVSRLLAGFYADNRSMPILACYLSYYGLMFLVMRWWKLTERKRGQRWSLWPTLVVAFWAYLLLFLLPSPLQRQTAFTTVLLASIAVQWASPVELEETPERVKRRRLRSA